MRKVNVYVAKYELIKTIQFINCDTSVASSNTYKKPTKRLPDLFGSCSVGGGGRYAYLIMIHLPLRKEPSRLITSLVLKFSIAVLT